MILKEIVLTIILNKNFDFNLKNYIIEIYIYNNYNYIYKNLLYLLLKLFNNIKTIYSEKIRLNTLYFVNIFHTFKCSEYSFSEVALSFSLLLFLLLESNPSILGKFICSFSFFFLKEYSSLSSVNFNLI